MVFSMSLLVRCLSTFPMIYSANARPVSPVLRPECKAAADEG